MPAWVDLLSWSEKRAAIDVPSRSSTISSEICAMPFAPSDTIPGSRLSLPQHSRLGLDQARPFLVSSAFANQYYIFENGRAALTVDGYAYFQDQAPVASLFSVTGGIGTFRGAAGDLRGITLGTNATGCPNFRARFRLLSRSGPRD
jgi:hypothetical protein